MRFQKHIFEKLTYDALQMDGEMFVGSTAK